MKNTEFGKKLKQLRMKEGLTQQELGSEIMSKKSSMPRNKSDISKWENCKRIPDYETILDLEEIFGIQGVLQRAAGYEVVITEKSTSVEQKEHLTKLLGVVTRLLANKLGEIVKWVTPEGQVEYHLYDENEEHIQERLTADNLVFQLEQNTILAYQDYTEWFFNNCFIPHLEAELQAELKSIGFYRASEQKPYLIIETLRLLTEKKTFKGTCSVCHDWS